MADFSRYKKLSAALLAVLLITTCDFGNIEDNSAKPDTAEAMLYISDVPEFSSETTAVTTTETTAEITDAAETSPEPRFPPDRLSAALSDASEFARIMDGICNKYNVAGLSAAVFANGEIIYTYNYGYSDKETGIKTNDRTKYRAASISKTVTAICAMMLAEGGELDLDRPVSDIIGLNTDRADSVKNTTRHLLTHTSSMVDTKAYLNAFKQSPPRTLKQILDYGVWSGDVPGTRFAYSNFAFGITGGVIECITGTRFYAYAQENLFNKLGMDAAYLRTLIKDADNIAKIYKDGVLEHNVKTWGRTETLYDKIPLGQSYGLAECELIISAYDLARFGIVLSGDGSVDGIAVLSPESVSEMNAPYISDGLKSYGLGLNMNNNVVQGRTITGHPGQALGMVGGLYFDSSDGTGVAILTNGCSVGMSNNGMYAINNAIVVSVYDWFFG